MVACSNGGQVGDGGAGGAMTGVGDASTETRVITPPPVSPNGRTAPPPAAGRGGAGGTRTGSGGAGGATSTGVAGAAGPGLSGPNGVGGAAGPGISFPNGAAGATGTVFTTGVGGAMGTVAVPGAAMNGTAGSGASGAAGATTAASSRPTVDCVGGPCAAPNVCVNLDFLFVACVPCGGNDQVCCPPFVTQDPSFGTCDAGLVCAPNPNFNDSPPLDLVRDVCQDPAAPPPADGRLNHERLILFP